MAIFLTDCHAGPGFVSRSLVLQVNRIPLIETGFAGGLNDNRLMG
ncbi:hypothetical protein LX87_04598 [Larkinella arboricola]|uniref:Uncharacterized protein n=1 Tax=Larkinella arboricola TaxID=643671 RepID=A0A327WQY6_LARAB|nr:hypothetical protein LX87_04598 [Larkinella arboricola]